MFKFLKRLAPRAALFSAAFAVSSGLMLALGAAFDQASSSAWLHDSPQARLALAQCEAQHRRAAQHDCLRAVVARAQARDAGAAALIVLAPLPR